MWCVGEIGWTVTAGARACDPASVDSQAYRCGASRALASAQAQRGHSTGAQAVRALQACAPCVRDAVCDAAACCMVHAAGRSVRCSPGCVLYAAMLYATRCNAACCMLPAERRRACARRRSFFARPRLLEEGRVFCVPVAASLVHPEGRRRFIGGAMPASVRSSEQDARSALSHLQQTVDRLLHEKDAALIDKMSCGFSWSAPMMVSTICVSLR